MSTPRLDRLVAFDTACAAMGVLRVLFLQNSTAAGSASDQKHRWFRDMRPLLDCFSRSAHFSSRLIPILSNYPWNVIDAGFRDHGFRKRPNITGNRRDPGVENRALHRATDSNEQLKVLNTTVQCKRVREEKIVLPKRRY